MEIYKLTELELFQSACQWEKNSNMPPRKKPVKAAAKPKNEAEVDSDKSEEEAAEVKGETIEKLTLEEDLEDEEDDDYDPEVYMVSTSFTQSHVIGLFIIH